MGNQNRFLNTYCDSLLKPFRSLNKDPFEIIIYGLKEFIRSEDNTFKDFISLLQAYDFSVKFSGNDKSVETLKIRFKNLKDGTDGEFVYPLVNLLSTIEFSSKTGLSLSTIFMMRIVSNLICKHKILYKAIVLDLDLTLWCGTLSEDGIEKIESDMRSVCGIPYIIFMSFIREIAKELGIFVAICSRNDSKAVTDSIEKIDEQIFPLKSQIDIIVANNNDKAENIKSIADNLHILPSAIVFIDDNQIERDKVRSSLPDVLVLDWDKHDELTAQIVACCIFDRFELSLNSQSRREHFRIIHEETKNSTLPKLFVKIHEDNEHAESKKLYAKSNQFKFITSNIDYTKARSLYFEIYRQNGANLGVCSVLSYIQTDKEFRVLNWAISCRYFEIGLEEFILMYLRSRAMNRTIIFDFEKSHLNQRAQSFIDKYHGDIFTDNCENGTVNGILFEADKSDSLNDKTNLVIMK